VTSQEGLSSLELVSYMRRFAFTEMGLDFCDKVTSERQDATKWC
jgi:hypothetical protein